jgi:hypothetical protein
MTREERHRILGPQTVAEIHQLVEAAPPATPQQIEFLRRIFAAQPRELRASAAA